MLSLIALPTAFAPPAGLSPLPHAASCSLKALQHWNPQRPLDDWAASLSCALTTESQPHATAVYKPTMKSTGWDVFEAVITTAGCSSDAELGCQAGAAAAGFLEGWLSAQRISDHLHNLLANSNFLSRSTVNSSDPKWSALVAYEQEQESWTVRESSAPGDEVMSVVPYLYAQQAGIAAGLAKAGVELFGLTPWRAAVTINLLAEEGDVLDKLFPERRVDWFGNNLSLAQRHAATLAREHCSAFIALGEYNEELFVGHNMWWSFYAMMPVLKTYTWEALPEASRGAAAGAAPVARRVQMSSLPGALSSIDDIYSLPAADQRLAVMETTNPLYDHALYERMSPRSLWCWARVMAANLLATDGAAWVDLFSLHNSGTYNNMWMVVDYKRFTKGEPLLPESGVLTIAEQLPGLISVSDETHRLATSGYFSSYNQPYLNATVHESGAAAYDEKMRKQGVTAFGYQLAGRAHLFRAYAHMLGSLEDAKKLLRWNKFQTDPVVLNSPDPSHAVVPATYGALASRGDLNPKGTGPDGVTAR